MLSVLVIVRSAMVVTVSVSTAVLLAGVGSVRPVGGAIVAVLVIVPVVVGATVAVRVNVADPDETRSTVVAIDPVPLVAAQLLGATAVQVQVAPVRAGGTVSVTGAAITLKGPVLVTTMV